MSNVQANLADVLARIAAVAAGRQVRLVAVSKTKSAGDVRAAYDAGQRHFGENYAQELAEKAPQLPADVRWHFIGHLQTNKAKLVANVPGLYMVETIDSAKLASALNRALPETAPPLRVLIQVNTSGEDAKSGVHPSGCVDLARHILGACPRLRFCGLMTIGDPTHSTEARPNPDFARLAECRDMLARDLGIPASELEISMGMSHDFEHAIEMGSNSVRVGSRIFGERVYSQQR